MSYSEKAIERWISLFAKAAQSDFLCFTCPAREKCSLKSMNRIRCKIEIRRVLAEWSDEE